MAEALHVDLDQGISAAHDSMDEVLAARRHLYGSHPTSPRRRPLHTLLAHLCDPSTLILTCAATVGRCNASARAHKQPQVATITGAAVPSLRAAGAWAEGVAMWLAILLVTAIGTCNPPIQYTPAPSATATDLIIEHAFTNRTTHVHVTVVRNGHQQRIAPTALVVGDVVCIGPGDLVPAHGLLVTDAPLTLEEHADAPGDSKGGADPWCAMGSRVRMTDMLHRCLRMFRHLFEAVCSVHAV